MVMPNDIMVKVQEGNGESPSQGGGGQAHVFQQHINFDITVHQEHYSYLPMNI